MKQCLLLYDLSQYCKIASQDALRTRRVHTVTRIGVAAQVPFFALVAVELALQSKALARVGTKCGHPLLGSLLGLPSGPLLGSLLDPLWTPICVPFWKYII